MIAKNTPRPRTFDFGAHPPPYPVPADAREAFVMIDWANAHGWKVLGRGRAEVLVQTARAFIRADALLRGSRPFRPTAKVRPLRRSLREGLDA